MSIRKIGRYEVIRELGRGGMATVFLASDPQFKREVAIKVLPSELLGNPEFRARFEREATTIASLENPAIVPVYDFGEEAGQPYLVMRYMAGGSLKERIRQGKFTLEQAGRIIAHLAPALDYAHSRGIIHRDLKPDNILFDQLGAPYLSDFGIAKLAESGATLTGNSIVGTPAYMSPEQGRGEADLDARSDLYSLGIILFEMLSGHIPFEAATPMGQLYKHLTEPVPDVLEFNSQLPPAIQVILVQALAKRRFVRFGSAAELSEALQAVLRGEQPRLQKALDETVAAPGKAERTRPTLVTGTPQPRVGHTPVAARVQRPPAPKKSSPLLPVFLLFVLVALVAGGWLLAQSPLMAGMFASPTPTQALVSADTPASQVVSLVEPTKTLAPPASATPEPSPTPAELPPSPTIAPAAPAAPTAAAFGPVIGGADAIAFISGKEIWISALDGTNAQRLTNNGGEKLNLQWSPDGQWIIYTVGRCALAVNTQNPAEVVQIMCANWADYLGGFQLSPDYKQVAVSLDSGIYVLPYDNELAAIRTEAQLLSADICVRYTDSKTRTVRWSNDGKQIAFIAEVTQAGRQVEVVKVYSIYRCGEKLDDVDQFPDTRFTIAGYSGSPRLVDFDWDGADLFVLSIDIANTFGQIYEYNLSNKRSRVLEPFAGKCCYRSFLWSPDETYFIFAFEDRNFRDTVQLYYVRYGTIGTGEVYQPIAFPAEILTTEKENVQPALRPSP